MKKVFYLLLLTYNTFSQNVLQNNNTSVTITPEGYSSRNINSNDNLRIGIDALKNNTAFYNIAIGNLAMKNGISGKFNIALGLQALFENAGENNIAVGNLTLLNSFSGNYNTAVGSGALGFTFRGKNTALGYQAGYGTLNVEDSSGVYLGYQAGKNEPGSNKLYISNNDTDNPLIWGDFYAAKLGFYGKVGIGTKAPIDLLNVHDPDASIPQSYMRFTNSFSGQNIGDGFRVGLSEFMSGLVWQYENNPIVFGTNNNLRMTIKENGKIGIGTIDPQANLHIYQSEGISSLILNNSYTGSGFLDGLFINSSQTSANIINRENTNLYFGTNNSNFLTLYPNLRVGIGLNNLPAHSDLHLHAHSNSVNTTFRMSNLGTGIDPTDGFLIHAKPNGEVEFENKENQKISFQTNSNIASELTILSNGNLGLGTDNPATKLNVENGSISITNTIDAKRWEFAYDQTGNYFYIDEYGSARRFVIENGGYVGIGTTNPSFPLEINNSIGVASTVSQYEYNQVTNTSLNIDYSMKANEAILARKFNAFSDNRHKLLLEYPDSKNALKTINQLKPATYKYIDSVALGRQINLGFMAQEVEKEYPEAVTKIKTEFIPNIYQMTKALLFEKNTKTLTLILEKPHGLILNDEIKVFGKQEYQVKVSKVINENTFEVKNWEDESERIFVFGKKVEDFRTVDYDRIFTLGISAIQELSKELNETKKYLLIEKNINLEQEKKLQNLETKLSEILNQIKQ